MYIKSLTTTLFGLVLSILLADTAYAQKAGDDIISIGGAYVFQNSSIGTLTSTGSSAAEAAAINAVNNIYGTTSTQAENVATLTTSTLHMFTDNIGTDVILGLPPKVNLNLQIPGAGPAFGGALPTIYPKGASSLAWTPVVAAKYFFNAPGSNLRPFLGVGINYSWFTHVDVENTPLLHTLAGSGAKLSSSWNPVATAGSNYNFDEKWSMNASVTYIPLKSTASFVSGSGLTTTTGTLKLDPTILNVAVGYKF